MNIHTAKPFFLSLKWKYAFIISMVLLILHGFLTWNIYQKSKINFENHINAEHKKQVSILYGLINQSSNTMEQFIDSITQLEMDKPAPSEQKNFSNIKVFGKITGLLENYWSSWQVIWGFESLSLYIHEMNQLSNWGKKDPDLKQLYLLVIKTESPQQQIHCHQQCILYIAVPVLSQGRFKGVLSVGISVVDSLIAFKEITGADIGILLKDKIPAVTNAKNNRTLVQSFMKSRDKQSVEQNNNCEFLFNNEKYRINFLKMNTAPKDEASFIVIYNINKIYQDLQTRQNNTFFIALISLLITFILLFILLEKTVIRIKYFSKALPFLALTDVSSSFNKYQQAKETLLKQKKATYFSDELDQLFDSSINLSNQLEKLEDDRSLAEEKTMWLATHDPLTNLHNRRYFHAEFEKILDSSTRYKKKAALIYLDLDQFKVINDTQGHSAGDKLLIEVADTLKNLVRKTDLLCRVGGDEFTIITTDTELEGMISLATKINTGFSNIIFKEYKTSYQLGSSIGIAIYPEHGSTVKELLTNADMAMYKAKESGFNLYHIYNPKIHYHQELNKRLDWKKFIERAISEKWLTLYYQPILDLNNNYISHYECLLRIIDNTGKITMPFEFIKYAEELGLIETVDKTVINLAIKKHIELQQGKNRNLKLAINLSGQSINNERIKAEIKCLLTQPEVTAEKIIFEITETSAVTNFGNAQSFISEIQKLGCSIALDDFGTGFSSFYYLKNMSFDYVKIDGSFIKGIETEKEDKIFVKALSDVSRALGKKTIAEFVETENIVHILKDLQIDYAQGYYINKPCRNIKEPE